MKIPIRTFALLFTAVALLGTGLPTLAAPAELTLTEPIKVVGTPMGRFGFMTGWGGPFWRPTIGHLVILDLERGGPADQAGIRKRDEIIEVDGVVVPGARRSVVFEAMRSKDAGSIVTFKLAADKGRGPVRTVKVRTIAKR